MVVVVIVDVVVRVDGEIVRFVAENSMAKDTMPPRESNGKVSNGSASDKPANHLRLQDSLNQPMNRCV